MDDEQAKRISRSVHFTEFDQVNSDFALAVALQEQEMAFSMSTIESESESESESDENGSAASSEEEEDEFLENPDIRAELELLEGEGSNSEQEQEMEEDDIDPDELSYEELIALGEFVGEESRGLSEDQIFSSLHPYMCQSIDCKTVIDRCAICQMEYEEGEIVAALPCDHPYHLDCISKWLQIKKICPICSSEVSSPKIARIV